MKHTGRKTNEKCPKCGSPVLYNGNLFCTYYGTYDENPPDGMCDWALPHPQTELEDKQIAFRNQGYWEVGESVVDGELRYIISREYPK